MMGADILAIKWIGPDESAGYTDIFPISAFADEGTISEFIHDVVGPYGGLYQAGCRLDLNDKVATLDYRDDSFKELNDKNGMLRGILRLHFTDRKRDRLIQISPAEWNGKRASVKIDRSFCFTDLPPYKIGKSDTPIGTRNVQERPGQVRFRRLLTFIYGGQCSISGCSVGEALEGAHIDPFYGESSDHPENGILLRRDLHSHFDTGLMAIDPDSRLVDFANCALDWPEYKRLHLTAHLADPQHGRQPSKDALKRRWGDFNP